MAKISKENMQFVVEAMKGLGSNTRDIRKSIYSRKAKSPIDDNDAYCPLCKKEDLFPISEDYGKLKCLNCDVSFDIPYFLNEKNQRGCFKEDREDYWIAIDGKHKGEKFIIS